MLSPAGYEIKRVFYMDPGQPGHFSFAVPGTLGFSGIKVPDTFAAHKKKSQTD
jgi:hypothetical protein